MQTLQPLIWLARSWTRPSVCDGTPPFSADARLMVLRLTITHGKIFEIDAVADPERLSQLDLAVLKD
jgi:hypothetical protein